MSPRSLKPTAGQTAFPEVEREAPATPYRGFELGQRRAFGGVLTPKFFNLAPDSVPSELSMEQRNLVDPTHLSGYLFERGFQSVDGLVLNSEEYTAIARNVEALGAAAVAKNQAANQLDPIAERRDARAQRAAQHTLFGDGSDRKYYEKMSNMLGFYKDEESAIKILQKEARTPGWAHMNANELLRTAAQAWTISFEGHILRAVGEHRKWDGPTKADALLGLRYRLFFDKQAQKIEYWREMLNQAAIYSKDKQILIRQRLRQIERKMDK